MPKTVFACLVDFFPRIICFNANNPQTVLGIFIQGINIILNTVFFYFNKYSSNKCIPKIATNAYANNNDDWLQTEKHRVREKEREIDIGMMNETK